MEIYEAQFLLFLVLFARITALIIIAPVFGHQSIPVQAKVALGAFLSFVLYPMVSHTTPHIDVQLLAFFVLIIQEVLVGLLLGFAVGMLFAGIMYAGEIISFSIGLSIANIFDPEGSQQTPVIGEFLYLLVVLIFIHLNGHHFVLEALQLTYAAVPIGTFVFSQPLADKVIAFGSLMFIVAVKFAAPLMVASFLTNVGLSILARVMPQMNIFVVSFPLSIGVGLIVLMSTAPFMVFVFKKLLLGFEDNIVELIKVL